MVELAPPSISGLAPERLMHLILAHECQVKLDTYVFMSKMTYATGLLNRVWLDSQTVPTTADFYANLA